MGKETATKMTNDTICAISTPPGTGGIAVCRISGPEALAIADRIWHGKTLAQTQSHTAHLGTIVDEDRQPLDQALATTFRAPASFTGQDTVEISVHGSPYIQQAIIRSLCKAGARLAQPGEFTRRAFIAGHLDLTQAEAIADLIASTSRAAQRLALSQMKGSISRRLEELRGQLIDLASLVELELDFSEEDVTFASRTQLRELARTIHSQVTSLAASFATGQAIKNGIPTAICGPTNAGKSSILNALLDDDRAIVSDIHGTTRDIIEDTIPLPTGHTLRLMDTAGLRDTTDTIEQLGIQRSLDATRRANIIIAVLPAPTALAHPDQLHTLLTQIRDLAPTTPILLALNKTDLLPPSPATPAVYPSSPSTTAAAVDNPTDYSSSTSVNHPSTCTGAIENIIKSINSKEDITAIPLSAKTGKGIANLRQALSDTAKQITGAGDTEGIIITNARQAQALDDAAQALARLLQGLDANLSGDLLAQDIRQATHHLATLTGAITTDTLLQTIFSRFCVGK